jgi:hypothetical protein
LLAISLLHAATPHSVAQRECAACLALAAPALAQAESGPPLPEPPADPLAAEPADVPHPKDARLLRPLRAPPFA